MRVRYLNDEEPFESVPGLSVGMGWGPADEQAFRVWDEALASESARMPHAEGCAGGAQCRCVQHCPACDQGQTVKMPQGGSVHPCWNCGQMTVPALT